MVRANHVRGTGERLVRVRNDGEVLKLVLRVLAVFEVIKGSGDDADPSGLELVVMCFELTQLDPADRSPSPAEKDEDRVSLALEVGAGEGAAVGPRGAELRKRLAAGERACVGGESGVFDEPPLAAGQQGDQDEGQDAPDAAPAPESHQHQSGAERGQGGHVPGSIEAAGPQLHDVEDGTEEQTAQAQPEKDTAGCW